MPAATASRTRDEAPPVEPKTMAYEALTSISVGRPKGDDPKADAADVVYRGEKVNLTEDEARNLLALPVPVIRPWTERSKTAPRVRPRDLFKAPRPPVGVRPDPPGSTKFEYVNPADPENHPEFADAAADLDIDPDSARDH